MTDLREERIYFGETCHLIEFQSGLISIDYFQRGFLMPSYSLSYDLRAPGQNYEALWTALGKAGAVRALESLWLLDDPKDAAGVRDAIRSHVDGNDRILVTQLLPGMNWASSNLMPGATEWLKTRFP